jgi:hypothetical protein
MLASTASPTSLALRWLRLVADQSVLIRSIEREREVEGEVLVRVKGLERKGRL